MPVYQYRAIDTQGAIIEGSLEANSEHALDVLLRQSDVELLRCSEHRAYRLGFSSRIRRRDLIGFCYHMEQMTRAGLPILEALGDLQKSIENPGFRDVIGNLVSSVETGMTLSQAMDENSKVFDDVFVSLIAVGEESGELPEVLLKLTESLKWQDELVAKAKAVIVYPAFVGVVVLGVLVFMMMYVVPQMMDFIVEMGNELPLHTRLLIGLSAFFVDHWWWLLPLPFLLVLIVKVQAARSTRFRYRVDSLKLRLWYIGPMISKIILSRFAGYFALCYSAGLDVLAGLRIGEKIVGNTAVRAAIEDISKSIGDGSALSDSMEATGLFPPLVVRMVRTGEATGRLDNALGNVSYFYDREVSESIERLKSVVEPTMTVVLGAIMAWIMLSVLGPIYDTISSIGI